MEVKFIGKTIEYPAEFKLKAVKTYLEGNPGGYQKVAEIYGMKDTNGYLSVVKPKKKYTKPGEANPKHNVLKRSFTTSCPYDKIATDVTEISMF